MTSSDLKKIVLGLVTLIVIIFLAPILMHLTAKTDSHARSGASWRTLENAAEKNKYIAELEKKIAGQDNKPAEEVFKNIQTFKGIPAIRVLRVMEFAFGPALGVDCAHCHLTDQWEKDDKEPKQTARKMWTMQPKINALLKETIGKGTVNCTTCHRGQIKPALNLSK